MENLERLSEVFKALSDPTRLKIVKVLSEHTRPKCVNALTKHLDISQSAVSQHLKILKQADIVKGERAGNFVHYALNRSFVESLKSQFKNSNGEEFFVINNNGQFNFGTKFWNQQNRIKILEDQLSELQNKTGEIQSLIDQLKKSDR